MCSRTYWTPLKSNHSVYCTNAKISSQYIDLLASDACSCPSFPHMLSWVSVYFGSNFAWSFAQSHFLLLYLVFYRKTKRRECILFQIVNVQMVFFYPYLGFYISWNLFLNIFQRGYVFLKHLYQNHLRLRLWYGISQSFFISPIISYVKILWNYLIFS